ncbi:hypothetical protein F9U64_11500 [Gracilibacillus oryzae]|uniref:ABC transporter ATP-binding protein n=2 Tax=Gracilibacillus oryzae TaxID=1672701 RepID=A0A7C8KQ44_9BACI|nr:hypothetical protein F9U64_11500 [Gracilibacillus oryzae]
MMAYTPQLLLLDEPFSGVDLISKQKMQADLLDFMENPGHAIIISTHQQEEISTLADHIWIMDRGKIVAKTEKDILSQKWMRMWVEKLPEEIKHHPYVVDFSETASTIVTNNFEELEEVLQQYHVKTTHHHRLELNEILAYLLEKGK